MSAIQFTTVVGPDGFIHPPSGVALPQGEIEVSVRPTPRLEVRAQELAAQRGFDWETLPEESRAMLLEDAKYEERGERPPRPGPGACKGMILYMAPDFDARLILIPSSRLPNAPASHGYITAARR